MYYTYAYLREDGTPYYIGKGKGKRYKTQHNVPVPPADRILFLKTNLTEDEAYEHEIYMISVFGRKNNGTGILRNLTDGGGPASGWVMKDSHKQAISKRHKDIPKGEKHMKMMEDARKSSTHCYSEEHRMKISQTNIERGILPPNRKGAKWYNNGVKSTLSKSHPGDGWVTGRL